MTEISDSMCESNTICNRHFRSQYCKIKFFPARDIFVLHVGTANTEKYGDPKEESPVEYITLHYLIDYHES
jgi:hypothetical protein